jgi:hypothetical protein
VSLALTALFAVRAEARPLETGLFDQPAFEAADSSAALERARATGATSVRIWLYWSRVAPGGREKPAGFDPSNPVDPQYAWSDFDRLVRRAANHGLEPIVTIFHAPRWAERDAGDEGGLGVRKPDPAELASFAEAAARRYGGAIPGLPRVRRWQVWNEPNLHRFLWPQFDVRASRKVPNGADALSPEYYRRMVRAFARAVHRVHSGNLVVAGGLAPFGNENARQHAVRPLQFMREFLCLDRDNRPTGGCKPLPFDVWSHHPYTEGGPKHRAAVPGNASLGDLPAMRRILDAAARAGRISSRRRVAFWVTEFSWETKPPDPEGVPAKLHARWVAEALYRMWRQRVSLVIWLKVRDDGQRGGDRLYHQSGLYSYCAAGWSCSEPKRSFTAFRFPFVAFRSGGRVRVWGRTPSASSGDVIVEQRRRRGGWRRVRRLRANRHGIFSARPRTRAKGALRARIPTTRRGSGRAERSLPFSLMKTPDVPVPVFGN